MNAAAAVFLFLALEKLENLGEVFKHIFQVVLSCAHPETETHGTVSTRVHAECLDDMRRFNRTGMTGRARRDVDPNMIQA